MRHAIETLQIRLQYIEQNLRSFEQEKESAKNRLQASVDGITQFQKLEKEIKQAILILEKRGRK